jgi:uncharacterized membrane protein YccC
LAQLRRSVAGVRDHVLARDIGLVRLMSALRMTVCVCAGMAAGYGIAHLTGLPGLVGMMIGALPGFLCCFVVNDVKASRIAARSAVSFVPFVVALFASLELHAHRLVELLLVVVLLFVQLYAPRFGVWAGDVGAGLFSAYLCGLLLPLPATDFSILAGIGAASLAVTIVLRTVFFRPNAYRSLLRAQHAFLHLGGSVLEAGADLLALDPADHAGTARRQRALGRLRRASRRFHEAALVADGLLATPAQGRRVATADELHERLFDTELDVEGVARIAAELAEPTVPAAVRSAAAHALQTVVRHGAAAGDAAGRRLLDDVEARALVPADGAALLHSVHRLALALSDLTTGAQAWTRLRAELPRTGEDVPFTSAITLVGGRPAGANPVLVATLAAGMSGPWRRLRISAPLRTALQGLVAVAIVEPLGLALGGARFYWGVIGVLVILAGTNSTHERVRKTVSRLVGTVVGGIVGIVLVALLGQDHPWWTLIVVVVCLGVGIHGFTATYSTWVASLVVLLCQVYSYSGQFGVDLITLRLAENGLGAVVATVVSAVFLPVATTAMIRQATGRHLDAVRAVVVDVAERPAERPTAAARALDLAGWQLDAVLRPLVPVPTAGPDRHEELTRTVLAAATRYARHLAAQPEPAPLTPEDLSRISTTASSLAGSLEDLHAVLAGAFPGEPTDWRRLSAPLAAQPSGPDAEWVAERLELLARLDAGLAVLAAEHGLRVRDEEPREAWAQAAAGRTALAVRRRFAAAPGRG